MTIDPLEAHRAEIAELSRRHAAGEIDRERFVEASTPHARVIAALERDAERDAVLAWVRVACRNPEIVEAVAVGAAHYLRRMNTEGRPGGG